MKHGSVYLGGISRGDTPPRDIPTMGAAGGRPKVSDMTLKELEKPCPYARDEDLLMPARHEAMYLNVLKKSDVPPGPIAFNKDYCTSLMTEDIELAQPTLAHPSGCSGVPVPWKYLNKPEPEYVKGSSSKAYNPPRKRGPSDLSLTTTDIAGAVPSRSGPGVRARSDCIVDTITPSYQFASSICRPPEQSRWSGRDGNDCSDIDGAQPGPTMPLRKQYVNPLRVEAEFRSRKYEAAIAATEQSFTGSGHMPPRAGFALRAAGSDLATPRPALDSEKLRVSHREGHPLEPRYKLPVAEHGSTLHIRYQTERHNLGLEPPPTHVEEVGQVPGSTPRAGIWDNGEPQLSLCTHDLPGARPQRRVGVLPHSMYGPNGNRPALSSSLDTSTIAGAQADTNRHGPLRSARVRAEAESARGWSARTPPEVSETAEAMGTPMPMPMPGGTKETTLRFTESVDTH